MFTTFANWVEYFDSLPLSDKVNKSHHKALLRAFNGTPDATTCETKFESEHESVFMAKIEIGGRMKLFHHFNKGATILISMNKRNTQPFKIDSERLLKKPTVETRLPDQSRIGSNRQRTYHRQYYHQSQELYTSPTVSSSSYPFHHLIERRISNKCYHDIYHIYHIYPRI